jgi:hypothetical protein
LEYLEAEINDRLFLRSDTDGFYKSIVENFTRPEAVDLDTSTVDVDFWGNTVKLKSYANSNNFLPRDRYRVSVSRPLGGVSDQIITISGSDLSSLDSQNSIGWTGSIVSKEKRSASIQIDIEIQDNREINEVYFAMENTISATVFSAIVTDENNNAIPAIEGANITNTAIIPVFKKAKKIQIFITKNMYDERSDSGEYRYLFHLKRISLGIAKPSYEKEGTFYSKSFFITNAKKVAIEVCDFTTEETSIDYFAELKDSDGNLLSYSNITPLNKPPSSSPYALSISDQGKNNNIKDPLPIVSELSTTEIISIPVNSDIYGYTNEYKIANQYVTYNSENVGSVEVFSNYKDTTENADELYALEGSFYTTWIYIEKNNQSSLNVGDSGIIIEGIPKEKNIIMFNKTGWFKVKIPVKSYFNSGSSFASLEELQERDPLYPYNGKYLIEGTNLGIAPYLGFKKQAKLKLREVGNLSQVKENEFCLLRKEIFFYILVNKQLNAKNLYIEYKKEQNFVYNLRIIAKLKSNNKNKSPIISSYKVKLGD